MASSHEPRHESPPPSLDLAAAASHPPNAADSLLPNAAASQHHLTNAASSRPSLPPTSPNTHVSSPPLSFDGSFITGSSEPSDATLANGDTAGSSLLKSSHGVTCSVETQAEPVTGPFKVNKDKMSGVHISEQSSVPFIPSLGAWNKRISIMPELKDPIPNDPPTAASTKSEANDQLKSDILPPEVKADEQLRFPWAANMDPKIHNLHRTTSPSYKEDGTPIVEIPNHVLRQGLENQKEYVIGQFYRCKTPSGGLVHAVANRIWGKKCKIFTRSLSDSSFLFHIPDVSTRAWILERKLWHFDDCIMFVGPWTTKIPALKNIPACLYSDWGISWIASGLGAPMLTNKPRLDPTQIGEAKLLVEMELDKPLPKRIAAGDVLGNVSMVSVEYSWIPTTCERCGQLGHKVSRCIHDVIASVGATGESTIRTATKISHASTSPSTNPIALPSATNTSVTPTLVSPTTSASPSTIVAHVAIATTAPSPCVEVEPVTPIATATQFSPTTSLVNANIIPTFGLLPLQRDESTNQEPFSFGTRHEVDVVSASMQRTLRERPVKPTQKVQDSLLWTTINRGKRGRGRGGRM